MRDRERKPDLSWTVIAEETKDSAVDIYDFITLDQVRNYGVRIWTKLLDSINEIFTEVDRQ